MENVSKIILSFIGIVFLLGLFFYTPTLAEVPLHAPETDIDFIRQDTKNNPEEYGFLINHNTNSTDGYISLSDLEEESGFLPNGDFRSRFGPDNRSYLLVSRIDIMEVNAGDDGNITYEISPDNQTWTRIAIFRQQPVAVGFQQRVGTTLTFIVPEGFFVRETKNSDIASSSVTLRRLRL